jgi:hypothetical protein
MRFSRFGAVSVMAANLSWCTSCSCQAAIVQNPSFEWDITGDWSPRGVWGTTNLSPPGATEGLRALELWSTGFVGRDSIATLLGVTPASLDIAVPGVSIAVDGSAVRQFVHVNAGDRLSFDYRFFDGDDTARPDTAIAVIDGIVYPLASASSTRSGWHDWTTFTWVSPTTGVVDLGFGILDANQPTLSSRLAVDNIVPAPNVMALGLFALFTTARRRGGISSAS